MQTPPSIEDGRVAALEQIARSARSLLEAEDAWIIMEQNEGREHMTSPRVHMARRAVARDLAALSDFDA